MAASDPDPQDIVARLRAATGEAHARLDARLNIIETLADPEARKRLVARFYGLHAGAEAVLAPVLGQLDGLDYAGRDRSPVLERDLTALGIDRDAVPLCLMEPPRSAAEALGLFYVLEGSTLGGRIIRREMEARGHDDAGLTFLDPYGAETGVRWRAFLDVLRRLAPPDDAAAIDAVVRGGTAGFAQTEAWLCGETA